MGFITRFFTEYTKVPKTRVKVTVIGNEEVYEAQYRLRKRDVVILFLIMDYKSRWVPVVEDVLDFREKVNLKSGSKQRAEQKLNRFIEQEQALVSKLLNEKNKKVTYYTPE